MKRRASAVGQTRMVSQGSVRVANDLGTFVRKLHKDYKLALALAIAGKSDAEIVKALNIKEIDEEKLKTNMEWLLNYLRLDSFDSPSLQTRAVKRALKEFWVYDFGPE